MKIRLFFAIIFSVASLSDLFAQNYLPLLEEGKSWDVIYFGSERLVQAYAGNDFFMEGDTIYNGIESSIYHQKINKKIALQTSFTF